MSFGYCVLRRIYDNLKYRLNWISLKKDQIFSSKTFRHDNDDSRVAIMHVGLCGKVFLDVRMQRGRRESLSTFVQNVTF